MNAKEVKDQLYTICDEIVKEIIEPVCQISGTQIDFWLSDISTLTMDDEELNQQVYEKIQDKYELNDDEMVVIDSFVPLIQIALYIALDKERPQYGPLGY